MKKFLFLFSIVFFICFNIKASAADIPLSGNYVAYYFSRYSRYEVVSSPDLAYFVVPSTGQVIQAYNSEGVAISYLKQEISTSGTVTSSSTVNNYTISSFGTNVNGTFYATNVPIFNSVQNMRNYLSTGVANGLLYGSESFLKPPISFDPFDYEYDPTIPTPNLTMDSNYRISFENGTSDLYVVAYTRWKSYANFNIYRDISDLTNDIFHPIQTINSYYYSGDTFTSDLYEVISVEDSLWSRMGFDLYGNYPTDPSEITNSFSQFISDYPVANRVFTYENGDINGSLVPNNAVRLSNELKQALAVPNSALNSPEVYFRYYIIDSDGVPHFGKWAKLTIPLGSNNYSTNTDLIYGTENKTDYTVSTNGIDNNSVIDGDNSGDNITINPSTGSPVIDWNINSPNFNTGIQNFRQALGLFGNFQQFVALVYSMLPPWMIALMGSTITMLCGLAVYHGIRG